MRAVDQLAQLIAPRPDTVRLRRARVQAFTTTSATLLLAGGTVPGVPYLTSYAPTVGDNVHVLQTGAGLLVIIGRSQ